MHALHGHQTLGGVMDALEAFLNASIGLVVSVLAVTYLWPLWGWEATTGQAVGVTAMFWALSAVRAYVLRKAFRCLAR